MSGYKRVSFYELCRLCATNQQKEKTHIFHDEGRKIQLQNKIQTCLSLPVCENDFLPKVVCSKCLKSLEIYFSFKQECILSESMLSSYFKNFRYTEDFKKSGKVYIKDTTVVKPPVIPQQLQEGSETTTVATNTGSVNSSSPTSLREIKPNLNTSNTTTLEQHVPFFTLQLPTIVSNPNISNSKQTLKNEMVENSKVVQQPTNNQSQVAYNLNTINLAAIKTSLPNIKSTSNEVMSNVVVNANGEVINIAQLVDFDTIVNQNNVSNKKQHASKPAKRSKEVKNMENNIVKIDLTDGDNESYDTGQSQIKYEKLPHIKSTQNNKYSYAIKVDDKSTNTCNNQTVIFNPLQEFNQNNVSTYSNYTTNNALYSQSNVNIVNTSSTNNLVNNNICNTSSNLEQPSTTVNLNILNQNLQELHNQNSFSNSRVSIPPQQSHFTNVIQPNVNNQMTDNNTSKTLPNNGNVMINNLSENNNSASSNNNQQNVTQKTHICDICQKSFKRREHLYQHVKLHTGFRPYRCDQCNKAFMRKEHLLRHMTLHSGQKNFTCNICDKSFSRNDNLLKHKKTHDKQTSYTCEICQKQFVMKHYYVAHKLTHGDKCHVATTSNVWGLLKT